MPTIRVWAYTRRRGECRSCHRPIDWATVVESGKNMPFDAPVQPSSTILVDDRAVEIIDTDKSPSHFATCPQASLWRRS